MNALNSYSVYLKDWPKAAGAKPTEKEVEAIHKLGASQGSKATFALAMYLRKDGATQSQVTLILGGPQLNRLGAIVTGKQAERVKLPKDGKNHTVYKIKLVATTKKPVKQAKAKKPASTAPAVTQDNPASSPTA